MNKSFILIIFYLISNIFSLKVLSQNMNSPYSIYGIGDIDHRIYNRTSGVGGAGLATLSGEYFINNNPASISTLPRSFYLFNVAAIGKTLQYSGKGIHETNKTNKDFWLKGLTLAVKVNKVWASSVGFGQFSNVNYKFGGSKNVVGNNNSYLAVYDGSGGLNDYYWTNAVSLGKHFSFGIKSSIIAGGINQTETITDNAATNVIETKVQDYFGSPRFEYGAIYSSALNKKWDFSLGGKFINKTRLGAERTITVTEDENTIEESSFIKKDRFYLPRTFGAGFTFTYNKKTSFVADYTHENWSPLNISGDGWRLINSQKISGGIEISKKVQQHGFLIEKKYIQFGGFLSNSYLRVHNTPINEFGITAGTGGRLNNNLLYTLSLEGGMRGTTENGLIKENFFLVTMSLTYRDFLFSKGRKYD